MLCRAAYTRRMALGLGAGTLLAACQPLRRESALPAEAKPVKLVFWTHNYQPLMNFVEAKIQAYKSVRPNVEIEYSTAPVVDHDRKIITTSAAGSGPDGFNNGDWNYPLHQSRGFLAPVEPTAFGKRTHDEVANLYFDFSLVGLREGGKIYGIPFEWNALSLYWNRKHFQEAGLNPDNPPKDWLTLTDMAVKLTQRDAQGNITRPGFQQSYGPGTEWPLKRLHPMIVQLGGDILSRDLKTATINSPEALEALDLYTAWTTRYKVSQEGFQVPGVQNLFAAGYLPLTVNGPYFPAAIRVANPNFRYKEDWDVTTFPQWPADKNKKTASALWRWALFVGSGSKAKEEMWRFIDYITSDWQAVLTQVGYLPSRKGWQGQPITREMPWLDIFLKDLEVGVPVPQTPKYQELAKEILEMLERIYSGAQTVRQSADEAKRKIDDILKQP